MVGGQRFQEGRREGHDQRGFPLATVVVRLGTPICSWTLAMLLATGSGLIVVATAALPAWPRPGQGFHQRTNTQDRAAPERVVLGSPAPCAPAGRPAGRC